MKLLLFPHAGGSAKSYCTMKRYFPENLDLIPLDPSGKGLSIEELPCRDIPECISKIIEKNESLFDGQPYAVFGHSMGSLLAIELVHQLKMKNLNEPCHVFFSGRYAPDEIGSFPVNKDSDDNEIITFFAKNGLIPEKLVSNKTLFDMFGSILCRDVRMAEQYSITPEQCKLSCDISIMYGTDDPFLKNSNINRWSRFTSGKCTIFEFKGDHFYYTSQKEDFCHCIINQLNLL